MSFQTSKSFVRLQNTIKDILVENREVCDCPIDCQVINTVKVQESKKDVIKIVHLPSVVQSEFNEATRTMLFNNSSPLVHCSAIFENICWTQAAYALLCQPHHKDTSSLFVYALI